MIDLNNIWSCPKCAEYTTKQEAKNHICYANLKTEKTKLIDEILGEDNGKNKNTKKNK